MITLLNGFGVAIYSLISLDIFVWFLGSMLVCAAAALTIRLIKWR